MQIITAIVLNPGYDKRKLESIQPVINKNYGTDECDYILDLITVKPTKKAIDLINYNEGIDAEQGVNRKKLKYAKSKHAGERLAWSTVVKDFQPKVVLESDAPKRCFINEAINFICIFDTDRMKIYKLTFENLIADALITLQTPVTYVDDLKGYYEKDIRVVPGLSHEDAMKFNLDKLVFTFCSKTIKGYTLERRVSKERSHLENLNIEALDYTQLYEQGFIREDIIFRTVPYAGKYPRILNYDEVGVLCSFKDFKMDIKSSDDEVYEAALKQHYVYNAGTIKRIDIEKKMEREDDGEDEERDN